jgi:hypothetical protein
MYVQYTTALAFSVLAVMNPVATSAVAANAIESFIRASVCSRCLRSREVNQAPLDRGPTQILDELIETT